MGKSNCAYEPGNEVLSPATANRAVCLNGGQLRPMNWKLEGKMRWEQWNERQDRLTWGACASALEASLDDG